jgi:hypothetical protein
MQSVFSYLLNAMAAVLKNGPRGIGSLTRTVLRYPIKSVAVFVAAPVLILHIARLAPNRIRRAMATAGLIFGLGAGYFAGTWMGKSAIAAFATWKYGFIVGLWVAVCSAFSIFVSAAIMLLAFNATCLLFLKMSTQEVADHLESLAK